MHPIRKYLRAEMKSALRDYDRFKMEESLGRVAAFQDMLEFVRVHVDLRDIEMKGP